MTTGSTPKKQTLIYSRMWPRTDDHDKVLSKHRLAGDKLSPVAVASPARETATDSENISPSLSVDAFEEKQGSFLPRPRTAGGKKRKADASGATPHKRR